MPPFTLVIFGVSSNLSQLKLLPALYELEAKHLLPTGSLIVGVARRTWSMKDYRAFITSALSSQSVKVVPQTLTRLLARMHYISGSFDDGQDENNQKLYEKLSNFFSNVKANKAAKTRMFYLATYPEHYGTIFKFLDAYQLSKEERGITTRVIIEKPIGTDLSSAQVLNTTLHSYFNESQIYRLDHYLGKETLQNILVFRFGNQILAPVLNREYIDHIEVTSGETFGIGQRGGYYDKVGALRDVGQNHILQMLTFATMERPLEFTNEAITKERIKLLKQLVPKPHRLVLGQYEGYRGEENVAKESTTETFFALETEIQNDRWRGVPIFIRAGKKLPLSVGEITFVLKRPVSRLFKDLDTKIDPDLLVYRIQPNEGIALQILTKTPGHKLALNPHFMQFCYKELASDLPNAHEKLLLNAMEGDQTFFNDALEVETQWRFIDALQRTKQKVHPYKEGSWGPKEAILLPQKQGHHWTTPSPFLCVR